jgi:hypothetical protein
MACVSGDYSLASVKGYAPIACALGYECKAKGEKGNWLVIAERGEWDGKGYPIKTVIAVPVDGETVKADIFYMVENGELKEAE